MSAGRLMATAAVVLALAGGRSVLAQDTRSLPDKIGDLNTVKLVEVLDKAGQVVLHGTMKTQNNTPNVIERTADLVSPTGQKAKGKVTIKIEHKDNSSKHQVEVDLSGMPTSVECELQLDGRSAGTFLTSKQGFAKFELERKEK